MIFWFILSGIVLFLYFASNGFPEKIDPEKYQGPANHASLMPGAEPIYYKGKTDVGLLLIHGFEGSPYTLKELADYLHREGHTVIAPLLPGHGTTPEDFNKTRYEHWYHAVHKSYQEQRPHFKKFFIVGFSMGGNLTLRLSINFYRYMPPTGIVLISTPVFLNGIIGSRIIIKNWKLFFSGITKYFLPYIKKDRGYLAGDVLSPWVGYSDRYTTSCLHSFKRNIGKVRPLLKNITIPACLIQANNDRTIPIYNLHYILEKIQSREKRAYLFSINESVSTRHVLMTHEDTKERVHHYILKFINDTLKDFDLKPEAWVLPERKPVWDKVLQIKRTRKMEI